MINACADKTKISHYCDKLLKSMTKEKKSMKKMAKRSFFIARGFVLWRLEVGGLKLEKIIEKMFRLLNLYQILELFNRPLSML